MRRRVLGMILAGGRGQRLQPLTAYRSKPSVPFGGIYRIIDLVLSNFVNSGIKSIYVLTQFKSQSLTEHLHRAWMGTNLRPGNFIIPVPAQMQTPGAVWYEGTADAIYQNLNLVRDTQPDLVCVFGGDHIYFMDVSQMIREHVRNEADVTIAAIPVPAAEASRLGVIEADGDGWVRGFHEKVPSPPSMPGDPGRCFASMGNYVFTREILERLLVEDAANTDSTHDFGADILPRMVAEDRRVLAYDFETNRVPGHEEERNTYWRDVGTITAYFEANLDLRERRPGLDVSNRDWPINTLGLIAAPTRFVPDREGRSGDVASSVLGPGTIVRGGHIRDCVFGRNVFIDSGAHLEEAILMDDVRVQPGCRVRRAIIDKNVLIDTDVGYDTEADRSRGWLVTPEGITVIPKDPELRPITTLDLGAAGPELGD